MPIGLQIAWLLILAIPVACVSWTVTHEEILRDLRDYCLRRSQRSRIFIARKCFFIFTCEYCFSHYVAAIFLAITRFQMLYTSWRGYLVALFALVWVANQYMSIYNRLRLDIKHENLEIKVKENDVEQRKAA